MKNRSAVLLLSAAVLIAMICAACGAQPETPPVETGSASAPKTEESANSGSLTSSDLENFDSDSKVVSDTDDPKTETGEKASNTIQEVGEPEDGEETEETEPSEGDSSQIEEPEENTSGGTLRTDNISVSYDDFTIKVIACEETTDINSCAALRVTYVFINTSDSQATFSTSVVTAAYQNDYRLANTSPLSSDPEYSAQLQFVQPGESVTCATYYLLDNTTDDVNIQVSNLLNSSDQVLSMHYTFS